MSDLTGWIQSYWFELASLTAQFAILVVLVWYARTATRNSTALEPSRRQPEPQPSQASSFAEASPSYAPVETQPAGFGGVGRMLSPLPEAQARQTEAARYRRTQRANPWRAMVAWLQAPMTNRGVVWRRVTRQIS
jgi:hypothetical protein